MTDLANAERWMTFYQRRSAQTELTMKKFDTMASQCELVASRMRDVNERSRLEGEAYAYRTAIRLLQEALTKA